MKPRNLLAALVVATSLLLGNATSGSAGPFAYITLATSGTVAVIDTATDTVLATIPVGAGPFSAVVNSTGTRVYVTNSQSSTVSVIDTTTNSAIATINVGAGPYAITLNPAGTRAYVGINAGGTNNKVLVIDTASNTVIDTIVVGFSPGGFAVNAAGTRLYVANGPASTLSVVDTSTNAVIATVPLVGSHAASGVEVHPSGSRVYVAGSDAQLVHVLDAATNTVVTEISVPGRPGALALNPAGTRLYVGMSFNANNVTVIDTATNSIVAVIPFGVDCCGGIDVTPDGTRVYGVSSVANTVFVIYAPSNTVVNAISVCCGPASWPTGFIGPEVISAEISVSIDIKPGSDPNAINPGARGVIPVAILTTAEFDAATVSPSTVRFGRNGNEASPVSLPGSLEDVDGDGDLDLVLHFRTQDTGIQCGDTTAKLTGETFAAQPIQGSDSIVTVGCN